MEERAIQLFTRFTGVDILYRASDAEYFLTEADVQAYVEYYLTSGAYTTVERVDPLPPLPEEPDPSEPIWVLINEPLSATGLRYDGVVSFTAGTIGGLGEEIHQTNKLSAFRVGNYVLAVSRTPVSVGQSKYGKILEINGQSITIDFEKSYGNSEAMASTWDIVLTGERGDTPFIAGNVINGANTTTEPIGIGSVTYNIDLSGTYVHFLDFAGVPINVTANDLKEGFVQLRGKDGIFKKYLSKVGLYEYLKTEIAPGLFQLEDENGALGMEVDSTGNSRFNRVKSSSFEIGNYIFQKATDPQLIFGIDDDLTTALLFALYGNGRLLVKTLDAPTVKAKVLEIGESILFPPNYSILNLLGNRLQFAYGFVSDYLLVISYGQSNSVGGGSGTLPITQIYDALTTNDGPTGGIGTNLIPYTHTIALPLLGVFNKFTDLISSENFLDYSDKTFKFIGTAAGQGSTFAEGLKKGTTPYSKLISQVTNTYGIAQSQGKKLAVPFVMWTQGENEIDVDTPYGDYVATMNQLIADLNTDIKALTGQKNNIPLIGYQIAKYSGSHADYDKISKAHLDLGLTHPLFICACPSYQFDYLLEGSSGGSGGFIVHFTPLTRLLYGAYLGIAAKRTLVDGKKFLPLHPKKFIVNGNNLQVVYHMPFDGNLEFDTTAVSNPGDYGFMIMNGVTKVTLSNIKIVNKNTVSIDCSESPIGLKFHYARDKDKPYILDYGTLTGRWGSRGCLRDNQGDFIKYETYRLDNWAVASYLTITI